MKQLVLRISVFGKDGKCIFHRDVSSFQTIQSCLDVFYGDGVKVELKFEEIEVPDAPVNNL